MPPPPPSAANGGLRPHRASLVAGAVLFLGLAAGPAAAEEPFDLPGELVDPGGRVTSVQAVEAAQDALVRDRGLQLFVVVVDDFDQLPAQEWVEQTARLSGLGAGDLALAVAADEQELALHVPDGTGLAGSAVASVRAQGEARLADGDVDGAVTAVATGLQQARWQDPARGTERAAWWTALGVVALMLVAGTLLTLAARRRSRARDAERLAQARAELAALGPETVALDRVLADADLEVAFAEAEFEPSLVADLRDDVATARADSLRAHRLRADVATGPSDAPRWQVKPAQALSTVQEARRLTADATTTLRPLPDRLRELRRTADLVPGRLAGLRDRATATDLPPEARTAVEALLTRARTDVEAGRPEEAAVPLDTVVEHLKAHAAG